MCINDEFGRDEIRRCCREDTGGGGRFTPETVRKRGALQTGWGQRKERGRRVRVTSRPLGEWWRAPVGWGGGPSHGAGGISLSLLLSKSPAASLQAAGDFWVSHSRKRHYARAVPEVTVRFRKQPQVTFRKALNGRRRTPGRTGRLQELQRGCGGGSRFV